MKFGLLNYTSNDSSFLKGYPRKDVLLGWDGSKLPVSLQELVIECKTDISKLEVDVIPYTKQEIRAIIRAELDKIEEGIEKFLDITTGTVAYNYYVPKLKESLIMRNINYSKKLPNLYEKCIILFNGKTLDLASIFGDEIEEYVKECVQFADLFKNASKQSEILALLNKSNKYIGLKRLKLTLPAEKAVTVIEVFKDHDAHLMKTGIQNFVTVKVNDVLSEDEEILFSIEAIRSSQFVKVTKSNLGIILTDYREYIESNLNKIELYNRMNKQEMEDFELLSLILSNQVPYNNKAYYDMLEELGLSADKLSSKIHNKFRVPMANIGVVYSVYEFIMSINSFGDNQLPSVVNSYEFKFDSNFFSRVDLYIQDFLKERRENFAKVLDTPYIQEETRIAILENRLEKKQKISKYDFYISLPAVYLNFCMSQEIFEKVKNEIESSLNISRKTSTNINIMQEELEFIKKYSTLAIIDFIERESLNYTPQALSPREVLTKADKDPEYEKLEREFMSLTHKDSLEEFQRRSSKFSLLNSRLLNLCRTNKFEYVNSIIQNDIVSQTHREEIFTKLFNNLPYIIADYMKV